MNSATRASASRSMAKIFGRIGRNPKYRTAKIQQVLIDAKEPLTVRQIEDLAGTKKTREHLRTLHVVRGIIERTADKRYYLPGIPPAAKLALISQPPSTNYRAEVASAARFRAGGETDLHKALKKYVADNPRIVGLSDRAKSGEQEYALPSGDTVDVYFSHKSIRTAIEVKSRVSPKKDIVRGLFQCVKYRAVLSACVVVENSNASADAVLVLESEFPDDLRELRKTLGVTVFDNVRVG